MRHVFFGLCIFSLVLLSYPATILADPPPETPLSPLVNPSPKTGAPFVSLPLVLEWEDENVPRAQSYRYELIGYEAWFQDKTKEEKDAWIKEWTDNGVKDWMEDGIKNGFLVALSLSNFSDSSILKFLEPHYTYQEYKNACRDSDGTPDECADDEVRTFIKEKQKHLWHVKSCEDPEGTVCGDYGAVWDFTYLPGPAPLKTPAVNDYGVKLPVEFDWEDVSGAKSYDLILLPCPPWMTQEPTDPCYSIPVFSQGTALLSEFKDDACSFIKEVEYGWGVASCLDEQASFCTDPNEFNLQSFKISDTLPSFDPPTPSQPFVKEGAPPKTPSPIENVPRVSKNNRLEWDTKKCAYFFRVNVFNEAGTRITNDTCVVPGSTCTKYIGDITFSLGDIKNLWDQPEDLDKTYSWNITPCWGRVGLPPPDPTSNNPGSTPERPEGNVPLVADCLPTVPTVNTDSEKWYFHTIGKPPALIAPTNNVLVKIPVVLSWQGDGVSYRYELSKDGAVKPDPDGSFATPTKPQPELAKTENAQLEYEKNIMEPGGTYSWHVKTCVDEEGKICGPWSAVSQFTTFPLEAPSVPIPLSGENVYLTDTVRWNNVLGANAYAYHLEYACRNEKENKDECVRHGTGVCPGTNARKTIEENRITVDNGFKLPYCMGQYEWKVLSCLDKACVGPAETKTAWSNNNGAMWKLTALQPPSSGAGLVPCGRLSNDDATPYDETEKCQLKHAGFLLQNLLDFILWKLSLATILVLAVITGATSYFSFGNKDALKRIKTTFRSFFVGFLILMFAWMFVNTVLVLFGFKFEFFGTWWEISF